MATRISPPADFESYLDRLTDPKGASDVQLFETKQKVLMFAAALAAFRGKAPKEIQKRGTGIRLDIFERAMDDGLIDSLAAVQDGLEVLSPEREEERTKLFEEYAAAGLGEIVTSAFEKTGDPLDNLLDLLDEARNTSQDEDTGGVDEQLLRSLIRR